MSTPNNHVDPHVQHGAIRTACGHIMLMSMCRPAVWVQCVLDVADILLRYLHSKGGAQSWKGGAFVLD